jgi:quercetin dioxygenase-like cupin family protein
MNNVSVANPARRRFLRAVPVAAAAGLVVRNAPAFAASSFAASDGAQDASLAAQPFKLFRAAEIADDLKALAAAPGNNNLVQAPGFTVVLTTEKTKAAAEFEWHEHRDHVVQILDGATVYELGGRPKGAHSKGPGEWLAPESEGHASVALNKGDMLAIPRGTLHRRVTAESVTFLLISAQGS